MSEKRIDKNKKLSKQQFLSLLDEIDNRKNEQLKEEINNEFRKNFDSIDWKKVTDSMQAIIAMRDDSDDDDFED